MTGREKLNECIAADKRHGLSEEESTVFYRAAHLSDEELDDLMTELENELGWNE